MEERIKWRGHLGANGEDISEQVETGPERPKDPGRLALQTAGMPGQNGMQHRSTWRSEQGSVYVQDVEGRWVDTLRLHD
jgi:hypothetical protein